jgi:aldose sugar dehydrogenase
MARQMTVWCIIGGPPGFTRALAALVLVAGLVAGAPMLAQAQAPRSPTPEPLKGAVRVETVIRGLEHPWALAFLPDGRLLVTERPGRLRLVGREGRLSEPLAGVPRVFAHGQGGLLDVVLDPRFADTRLVYLSYAEPGEGRTAGTAVARGASAPAALKTSG